VLETRDIISLFDRWNQSLHTGDPQKVVANYAELSILLPTASDIPRFTVLDKIEYFSHFLKNEPSAEVDIRQIQVGNDIAVDSELYTFHFSKTGDEIKARYSFVYRYDDRQWLIISHHSSLMPITVV